MTKPTYSVSSLMVYEICPLQYYTTFVRGVPPPRSRAMETGTSIHKLIADHLRQRPLLPAEIEPELQAMLDTFRGSRFNLPPIATEKRFVLPLEPGNVRGRIDLVLPRREGGVEIVDFKSGSARPREDLERSLQLPLYTMASGALFDARPEEMTYTYYFPREGAEVSFSPTPDGLARIAARVEGIMQAIQDRQFDPPAGCECHACQWQRRWQERNKTRPRIRAGDIR